MIYTVLSLFALFEASFGSRRLLQIPEFVPITPATTVPAAPAAPVPPAQGPPAGKGVAPPAAGTTIPPAAGTTIPPAAPAPPAVLLPTTTAAATPGGLPPLPFASLPPLPGLAPQVMECVVGYTEVGTCAGSMKTITSAGNQFVMNCAALGACAQGSFTFDYAPGGMTQRIEGIYFTEAYAGWGTTITINNRQGGNTVLLDKFECKGATACQDMTIILNNADLNDLVCEYPQDCANCFVKEGPLDPFPKPCFGW